MQAELFLDKDQTAAGANCDEAFTAESLVWATVLHLDPGPALARDERLQLEHAREQSVEGRRSNKHIRVTALLEGTLETKGSYAWSSGSGGIISHGYGTHGSFPARIVLTKVSEVRVEILPDAEVLPVIDACEVFSNLMSYNGKRVAIRGEIISGYHGSAVYGVNCKTPYETDGYRWPSALYLTVPFHDSRFLQPVERDRRLSATTDSKAVELIRGRKNVRAIFTVVGIVHAREKYHAICSQRATLGGNGFGEVGFAPAEFFEETLLGPAVEPSSSSGDNWNEPQPCPSPDRPGKEQCSRMDIVAAASNGCLDRVRELATHRPIDRGNPALVQAAANGFVDVVHLLLEAGIAPTAYSDDKPALCEAIYRGKTDVVEALIAGGASIDNRPEAQCSLLGAASRGDPKMIGLLVHNGANLELSDYFGRTPLMLAAQSGNVANLQALLDAGANFNAEDRDGRTALNHGASKREVVRILLQHGARVDAPGEDGVTPLMWAAWGSHDDIVRLLLEAGASVNFQDRQGDTALHKAVRSGYTDAIPVLLQFGADPELRNEDGKKAVDLAHGYQREALRIEPQ